MTNVIQIIIADDHPIFRKGLISLFYDDERLDVIGESSDGLELIDQLAVKRPDILLLDLEMPKMSGHDALLQIKTRYPEIKIIIVSSYYSEELLSYYQGKGINGYIRKESASEVILNVIDAVHRRCFYFENLDSSVRLEKNCNASKFLLTRRELEVLRLICRDLNDREIALSLGLSVHTIRGYRKSLYEKTNTRRVTSLVTFAARNGFISVHETF